MKKQTRLMPNSKGKIAYILLSGMLLTGCAPLNIQPHSAMVVTQPSTHTSLYFDTVITLSLYEYSGSSDEIFSECDKICEHYEGLLSATYEGSDIWNINHADNYPVEVDPDTAELIRIAIDYCELSQGMVDITLGKISNLWNFSEQAGSDSPTVPSEADILDALSHVDYRSVSIDNCLVTKADQDAEVELGFIAKGYIADKLAEYLESTGVTSAIINLGGNVLTIGSKPSGEPFRIGIQKPFDPMNEAICQVSSTNNSVVSSGIYQRYFYNSDILYHHILDTSTGYPVTNNIYGVSIIAPHSTDADALSTLCFILGPDDGIKLIETIPNTEVMYITDTYETISSSGWN